MTSVTILQPTSNEVLVPAQSLLVEGHAAGQAGPDPIGILTVTVSVDGGPPVHAHVTIPPHHQTPTVQFSAVVTAPSHAGTHTIRVTATDESDATATATVTVVVGPTQVGLTPRDCLRVSAVNAAPPPSAEDWAVDIVKDNRSSFPDLITLLGLATWQEVGDDFPICAREWTQVLAPTEDSDSTTVGFSGWLLQPAISTRDVPFTHPFGMDWECMVALDPEYAGLLAAGNSIPDGADGLQAEADARALGITMPFGGLLAVETDSSCVPSALKPPFGDTVRVGDRIAVFGRWIVDTAHHVDLPGGHGTSYRTEVHPPLLMAIGGARPTLQGDTLTRIIVTSRPYLVKQVYATDIGTIYDDSAPEGGTFLAHLNSEMHKLTDPVPHSLSIEAHPKIASKPFTGDHEFRLSVEPPRPAGLLGELPMQVEVSYQFTCRSGVGVQVLGFDDHVDVVVSLTASSYQSPALPPRQTDTWTKDRLSAANSSAGKLITWEQITSILAISPVSIAIAEHALAHGVDTDKYDVPDVNALDRSHAVPFVSVNQIPDGQGIVIDDSQPYPVFGFVEIRRHRLDIVSDS